MINHYYFCSFIINKLLNLLFIIIIIKSLINTEISYSFSRLLTIKNDNKVLLIGIIGILIIIL